jgi:hypothetical protein
MGASQVSQQPAQQTVKGPCLNQQCGKDVTYIMPVPRIFNDIDVSCLMIAHPPSRCPTCGAVMLPLIKGISAEGVFELEWKMVKVSRSPIIVGSNDKVLKDAIEAARFTEKIKTQGN